MLAIAPFDTVGCWCEWYPVCKNSYSNNVQKLCFGGPA